jgi:predicted anti-sigma-YlaC factor YlaD
MTLLQRREHASLPESAGHLDEATVNDFADGVMDAGALAAANHHLSACRDCRAEVSRLSELISIARADANLVVAPPQLEIVVFATTIHERLVKRRVIAGLRIPLLIVVFSLVISSVMFTAWVLLVCNPMHEHVVAECTEPWYFKVRDAARERYKQLRNEQRDFVRKGAREFLP